MTAKFICANWSPGSPTCEEEGKYTCKNCFLVIYCGSTCQKSHWPHHKVECKSPLGKQTWQPSWILEQRTPDFIGDGNHTFGGKKYLWGNVPAFDVLKLESNEGEEYDGDLRLLFAASGDIRNLVRTVANLPSSYNQSVEAIINDRDFDIVAQNLILLLIALVVENVHEAVDCIIHLWYSTLVRTSDIEILHTRILPLIEDISEKVKDKPPGKLLAKTWKFGTRSLRIVLEQSFWIRLLSFFKKPAALTIDQANETRKANTLAHSRRDYQDRYMLCLSPTQRIAFYKFRQDGLLLPFGYPRHAFREPNPTFFQDAVSWPMKDNADPLHGWPLEEVSNTTSGAATADIYGKLFFYLRGQLHSFLSRVSSSKIAFELHLLDVTALPEHLEVDSFSRIDVSNISDRAWLGLPETLSAMVPLLQSPLENPHATLITLFMNAVEESLTDADRMEGLTSKSQITKRLMKYFPPNKMKMTSISRYDPIMIKVAVGRELITTWDDVFDRFMKYYKFKEASEFFEVTMKNEHTIIEKWPYKLKLRPGQPGAQDEFDRALTMGVSGKERYVEWKRVPEDPL
ncbi:hypothetical protein N7520_008259 [Penicillium odoratum]|uniref:uncharacterized protein n=1 Tax=Penicillium odoratum TaxID=1167516 RepID=UPI002547F75E|nr:uncharacterized protein N7520_008259 [Penicillium odoratum]KAJ5761103.1 hypothetical protein N7520_008259 [Penicillium odoratum]